MSEDILERAKAADIDTLACTDWGELRDLVGGLLAEVERWKSAALDELARRQKVAAEVERLQSEKPFLSKETIRPSINLVECEKTKEMWRLKEEIADKDSRIKELRSRCQKAEELNKRLEAAFLDNYLYIIEHRQCHYPGFGVTKEMREEARAALEELRRNGKM